ncbi:T9SS type A sorting domain-containing protein [Nonlabens sp.]|uniref:T9SS type A sorting domain-containing protein n=1 Tax=Nonlabens sp. TaxID=1888209 RepID=UPI003F695AAE
MKKFKYILLLIVVIHSSIGYSQKREISIPVQEAHCGILHFDQHPYLSCSNVDHHSDGSTHDEFLLFEDRFGNIYCDDSFKFSDSDDFEVRPKIDDFDNFTFTFRGINADYQNIIKQVFRDLSELILSADDAINTNCYERRPRVLVMRDDHSSWNNGLLDPGTLAAASTFYRTYGDIQNGHLWEVINTGSEIGYSNGVIPQPYQVLIVLNSARIDNNEFFTGFAQDVVDANGFPGSDGIMDDGVSNINNQFDLYGLILHEALHAFGIASRLNEDGEAINGKLTEFALLLNDGNGNDFINQPTPYTWQGNWASPADYDTNYIVHCGNTIATNSPFDLPLYSSDPNGNWNDGSSLSHINDNCVSNNPNQSHIMARGMAMGDYLRLSQDEVDILHALDYTTTGQYGTATLANGTPNPNRNTFISNIHNAPPYAMQDPSNCTYYYTTCNNNGVPTFDLNAHLQNFIANDINAVGFLPDHFELVIPENGTIVNGMLTIDLANYVNSIVQVKYKLVSQTDPTVWSNTNYINIAVESCVDDYFNTCNDTLSDCDLICNSELVASSNRGDMNGFANVNTLPATAINGWYAFSMIDVMPSNLPSLSNDNYVRIQNSNSQSRLIDITDNPYLMTPLSENLNSGQKYILSYFNTSRLGDTSNVGFFHDYNIDTAYPDPLAPYSNSPNGPFLNENSFNESPIFIDNNLNNVWKQNILSFSLPIGSNEYNALYLNTNLSPTLINYEALVDFDQVELIVDNFDNVPTVVDCDLGSVSLGMDLCTITGMTYSWFEVTNSPTQLTNGTTITNAGAAMGITSANLNSNGSQLILDNLSGNPVFELRRVLNPLQGTVQQIQAAISPQFVNETMTTMDSISVQVIGDCATVPDPCDPVTNVRVENRSVLVWDGTATSYDIEYYQAPNSSCNDNTVHSTTISTTSFSLGIIANTLRCRAFCFRIKPSCSEEWSVSCCYFNGELNCFQPAPCDGFQDLLSIPQPLSNVTDVFDQVKNIEATNIIIDSNIEYVATETITLLPGFHAVQGTNFVARIDPCIQDVVVQRENLEKSLMVEESAVKLFPNPATNEINLQSVNAGMSNYIIYDMSGKNVGRNSSLQDNKMTIPIHQLSNGVYFIKVELQNGNAEVLRFIKK